MSDDVISQILVVSLDETLEDDVRTLRGAIEENHDQNVVDFASIKDLYKKQPSYVEKLRKTLNIIKLAIFITPSDMTKLSSDEEITKTIGSSSQYSSLLNEEAIKLFLEFLKIEKAEDPSKLVFVTLGGNSEQLPEMFGSCEHITNILTTAEDSDGKVVDTSKLEGLLAKCKREARETFPSSEKT